MPERRRVAEEARALCEAARKERDDHDATHSVFFLTTVQTQNEVTLGSIDSHGGAA